jgi:Mg2+ and Co2+ transporter CorA
MADQEGTMADTIPPIHSPNDSIEVQRDTLSRRIEYFARLSRLSTNSGDQASISAQQNNDMERLSNLPSDTSKLRHTIWFTADGNATVIMTAYELPYDNRVRGKYARGCLQEMRERMQLASVDPQIASDIEDRIQRAVDENTHSLAVTEGLTEAQLAEIGFR